MNIWEYNNQKIEAEQSLSYYGHRLKEFIRGHEIGNYLQDRVAWKTADESLVFKNEKWYLVTLDDDNYGDYTRTYLELPDWLVELDIQWSANGQISEKTNKEIKEYLDSWCSILRTEKKIREDKIRLEILQAELKRQEKKEEEEFELYQKLHVKYGTK